MSRCNFWSNKQETIGKNKSKVHPRTGHESSEEYRYSCTFPLTLAFDWVGGQRHASTALPPGKRPGTQKAGWAPGPVCMGAEDLASTWVRSQDRRARSELLYRLLYPGPQKRLNYLWINLTSVLLLLSVVRINWFLICCKISAPFLYRCANLLKPCVVALAISLQMVKHSPDIVVFLSCDRVKDRHRGSKLITLSGRVEYEKWIVFWWSGWNSCFVCQGY